MSYILHNCTREFVYPVERNNLEVKISVSREENCDYYIVYWNTLKKDIPQREIKMHCYARDNEFDYYFCNVISDRAISYLRYYIVMDKNGSRSYANFYGINSAEPKDGFFEYHYTNENDVFETPEWAENAIVYQIFPERFYNGDNGNDPKSVNEWGGMPTRENYFGGDIKGIHDKLEYINSLGIDAIYLTPIFKAASNHKYDTIDYFKIDEAFGTMDEFVRMVEKAHKLKIKVILDGVFNHCGYYFGPFQDVLQNGEKSEYRDWFYIPEFPVQTDPQNYECVGYYKWMPKLRHKTAAVRKYILDVVEYWIKEANIDGWRLDVCDEIDFTLLQEIRRKIKSINQDILIIGETWTDGRDLLRGDTVDSVMNYLFRDALLGFVAFGNIDAKEFDSRLGKMLSIYNRHIYGSLYNMLGSHDTDRFLTLCGGNIDKMKLAIVFQMAFPGMPAIYYGDEAGLLGNNDPDCRRTMEWNNQNEELKNHYKEIINLKKSSIELQRGEFRPVLCDNSVYGFARVYGEESVYIIINSSDKKTTINLPVFENSEHTSLVNGKKQKTNKIENAHFYNDDIYTYNGYLKLELNGYGFDIIKK